MRSEVHHHVVAMARVFWSPALDTGLHLMHQLQQVAMHVIGSV
jgi:hypothetical protein